MKPELPALLVEQLAAALEARGDLKVVTSKDIEAMLGFDRQKQLLGCAEASCAAELGGAMGVEWIVAGSISQLETTFLVSLTATRVATASVEHRFSAKTKARTADALLDLVPRARDELFPLPPASGSAPVAQGPAIVEETTATPNASSAGMKHFEISVRGQMSPLFSNGLHGAIAPGIVAFRINDWVAAGLGAIIAAQSYGVFARAKVTPLASSLVHPIVGLEVPVLFPSAGVSVGIGAFVGVELVPIDWLSIGLEIPVQYFVVTPSNTTAFFIFGALSIGVRV